MTTAIEPSIILLFISSLSFESPDEAAHHIRMINTGISSACRVNALFLCSYSLCACYNCKDIESEIALQTYFFLF